MRRAAATLLLCGGLTRSAPKQRERRTGEGWRSGGGLVECTQYPFMVAHRSAAAWDAFGGLLKGESRLSRNTKEMHDNFP